MTLYSSITSITALVLAGGLGTRLRSVTGNLPKVLAPVAGRPFLHYLLRYLCGQGVSDIVLCTGYAADRVVDCCGNGATWDINLRYSVETKPLGTGGAIGHARQLITSNPFLVLNGDSFVWVDLACLRKYHVERQALVSMVLVQVPDKTRFGSVLLAEDQSIVGFSEKGDGGPGWINAGIYMMNQSVLSSIPTGLNVSIEKDIFPNFVSKGLYGFAVSGPFIDIGVPDTYIAAQTILPDLFD